MNETAQQNMENHPVIRTLYDHVDEVTCLAFHPTEQILASGSRDYTLKLFDYSKPSAKRAFKYIQVRNVWKGAVCIFFSKYNELSCGSSLFKSRLSGHPRNKEDAARTRRPPQMARLSCCHAPTSSGQSGRLPVTDTVHNPHHSLKVADSYLKTKHSELL